MNLWISIFIFILANWLLYRRLKQMIFCIISIIFSCLWVLASVLYLDHRNQIYAEELFRKIGGDYGASVYLALAYLTFTVGLLTVFNRSRLSKLLNDQPSVNRRFTVFEMHGNRILTFFFGLFILGLYIKLFQHPIPLFSGMDRHAYKIEYDHFLLRILYKYSSFIGFFAGILTCFQLRIYTTKFRYSVLILFFLLLGYFVLIGNKFSTPFFCLCMFLIPLGLSSANPFGIQNPSVPSKNSKIPHSMVIIVGLVAAPLFIFAQYTYYTSFWNKKEAAARLKQRVLVKQGQMWWSAHHRVCERDTWNPEQAFSRVFWNPLVTNSGNTALRYLIYQEVGEQRLRYLAKKGYLYTGAYPAIFLELFGPYYMFPVIFVFSIVFSSLLYMLLNAIRKRHYLSLFFIIFVLQPFLFIFIGGNLYFFMNWKYWLKSTLMLLAILHDNQLDLVFLNRLKSFRSIHSPHRSTPLP